MKRDFKLLDGVVFHVKHTRNLRLPYRRLDVKTLKLYVFVDRGYDTNVDNSSQLEMIICLVDSSCNFHLLH